MAYHAIVNQKLSVSRKSGAEMVTITFWDMETREELVCYVDSSMENFEKWAEVITQPEKGFILTGMKRKRSYGRYNHEILNADSDFTIVYEHPNVEVFKKKIQKMWAKEDFEATPFGRMFGQE